MRNGAVVLERGGRVFGLELEGMRRGLSSIRAAQGFQSGNVRGSGSWKCESCGRLGGVVASSPQIQIRRPANKTIHSEHCLSRFWHQLRLTAS